MDQPDDTHTTKSGDGYITEADMAAHLKASQELKTLYAEELKNGGANVFFKKVLLRDTLPPNIYPPVHSGIRVLPSPTHGRGVFCEAAYIPANTFLAAYPGTVTDVDNNSSYSVQICRGMQLFIEGTEWNYTHSDKERTALYFNSITRWDGSEFGGANCAMVGKYPQWPYIVVMTLTRVTKGQELLIDYHWFEDIISTIPCANNCKSCYPPNKRRKTKADK